LGVSGSHGQFVTIQRLYDFRRQERLQLLDIGILATKVAKYVPATANQLQFFAFHPRTSFNGFNRSLTRSILCFGVLMPCFDFFWNA
jgi:hypothetical protein